MAVRKLSCSLLAPVARHGSSAVSIGRCGHRQTHRLLLSTISIVGGAKHRPTWLAMARSKKSRRQEQQEDLVDMDSTTELMEQVDQVDIDTLLNDEAAMSMLRNKLLSEMSRAHGEAAAVVAPPQPRGRAFDSDEYDFSALETGNDTESIDEIAQEAAYKLAMESNDIAEHIIADHKNDNLIELPAQFTTSSSSSGSQSSRKGSGAGMLQQQQQQPRNSPLKGAADKQQQQQQAGKAAAGNQNRSSAKGSSSGADKASRGSSSSSSSSGGKQGSGGGSSGSSLGSVSRSKLSGDTAIGRVAESKPGSIAVVVLKKGKARLFESGSPMVYSGAVECVVGRPPPVAGDVVVLADTNMTPIAWGVFNPVSMFRVRILQVESEALCDDSVVLDVPALVELRVRQAVALRATLGLPSAHTNVARLVNSEGDRLSGVIADMLGDVVVVQSCAAWCELYRDCITATLLRHTGCRRLVWRPAAGILKEEGLDLDTPPSDTPGPDRFQAGAAAASSSSTLEEASPMSSQSEDGLENEGEDGDTEQQQQQWNQQQQHRHGGLASHSSSGTSNSSGDWLANAVQVQEAGLSFLATPEGGQKTGFYADQRANRSFIASMAAGKSVLDLCCYSGGFGLAAAAAGAAAVTGVDSSASAVELATANAELNGLSDRCAFVRDDATTFLRAALEAGQAWDIVILDPPKLAPNRASLGRAGSKYRRLNVLALGVVRSGGVLMTCSCSGAMTQSGELPKIINAAAAEAERQVTLLAKSGAAPDHPLHPAYPEGEYLTALTYRVV